MRVLAGLRRWQADHPRRVDALVAVVVFAAVVGDLASGGGGGRGRGGPPGLGDGPDALTLVVVAGVAGALVVRRSRPLAVWGVSLAGAVLLVLLDGEPPRAVLLLVVTLYTLGTRAPLRTVALATLATVVVLTLAVAVARGGLGDRDSSLPAFAVAAAAIGVAVRSQRSAVEAAEARARQAEATREEEAVRRVTDERLRIARELHDVVAHHISVINVQAGVARHLLDTRPDQARTAMTLVREASRTVLSEMSTVLGLLRTGEDETELQPAPGLDQLPALVEGIGRAGLRTGWRVTGTPAPLPGIADLAAYRIVQESLTNALRHGTGTAELHVDHQPSGVVVQVRNPVPAGAAAAAGGHGLVGMRERAAAVGGRLSAAIAPDGLFTVRAEIPRGPA